MSSDGGATWHQIEGATSTTYTIASASTSESGDEFRAVFLNSAGEATSKAATLTVRKAPAITGQPQNATVEEGHTATFEASASGFPTPTVQWQQSINGGTSWKNISGATTTVLSLANVKTSESGDKVRAIFKNVVAEAITEAATLTVQVAPKVTKQPVNDTVNEGQSAIFEATATGVPTPSVQWEVSTDGGGTWEAVPGQTFTGLLVSKTTAAMSGNEYRARFTNAAGTTTSAPATLTVQSLPIITTQPRNALIFVGGTATFEAAAKGTPPPAVRWEVSTNEGASWSAVPGATTNTLTVSDAPLSDNGSQYRAAFTNTVGTTDSSPATLTVSSTDYAAYGWGENAHGEVGIGSTEGSILTPMPIHSFGFVTAISAGSRHSLALLADGSVWSWGSNADGQLGVFDLSGSRSPVEVSQVHGVKAIAAGGNHSLALLDHGTVEAWGEDESGELGDGKLTNSELPVAVQNLSGVTAIAAGKEHSLALLSDGTVMAWGSNERGQLGTGDYKSSSTPVEVKGLTHVTAIAAGGQYSLALLEDGKVMAWGDDEHYELGNAQAAEETEANEEDGLESDTPVEVEGLSDVTAIAAGTTHDLALRADGTVWAWGEDKEGELGNGAIEARVDTPAPVAGLSHVKQISAGTQDSVALLETGGLMAWGSNSVGNLGVGTAGSPSDVPVQVHGLAQVMGISAGGQHVMAFGESVPVVTAISPQAGPASGGGTVSITGEDLAGVSAVQFGATSATSFKVESSSSITATAPAGTGTVDVTVTGATGTSPIVPADRYSYRQPPTVTKLSAKGGPASGGTTVTITGTELSGASEVSFGGVPAAEFTVTSPTSITAVSPANVGGTLYVTVKTVGGTSATSSKGRFKYTPLIESLTPATGPVAGGSSVAVSGAGFSTAPGATEFKFGKAKVVTVECTSSTSCTVTAPPAKAAGAVEVQATVGKAKSATGPSDRFTYE